MLQIEPQNEEGPIFRTEHRALQQSTDFLALRASCFHAGTFKGLAKIITTAAEH